jgi:hypothetical protein
MKSLRWWMIGLLMVGSIVNAGGATDFCARFLDENDRPIKGLTATLTAR